GRKVMVAFDEQTEAAEREIEEQNAGLLAELEDKLSRIPDDDFEQRGRLLNEHSNITLARYASLEQKIRDIAAKIIVEQIKAAE
ncbi:MAG: hypothetical protein PHU56_03475, partial [Candidatus Pacebacteria bacterium]|nr:hypothetical protein [Candidatus Paceibacterota bacterium]